MSTTPSTHPTVAAMTTAPIAPGAAGAMDVEFIRVPDCERVFGIRRGKLYQMINEGLIDSVCLRPKGKQMGCRLISVPSMRRLMSSLMAEQRQERVA